jgi:hypothetical protein
MTRRVSLEVRKERDSKSRPRLGILSTNSYKLYRRLHRASQGAAVPESATGSVVKLLYIYIYIYIRGTEKPRKDKSGL